jgi:hypothetical protein
MKELESEWPWTSKKKILESRKHWTNPVKLLLVCFVRNGFELRASHLKVSVVPFETHLQSIFLWLFWRWGGGFSQIICPGWSWMVSLPISASQVAKITGGSHWCLAILQNFWGQYFWYSFLYLAKVTNQIWGNHVSVHKIYHSYTPYVRKPLQDLLD